MTRMSFLPWIVGALLVPTSATAQSLDETVAATFEHSPVLEAARAREDAADSAIAQAKAENMPSASLQAQIGIGRIDPQGFFALPPDNVTPRVAQIGVEWPIFSGGRISAALAQAKGGRDLAALAMQSAALDLRLQVVRNYSQALAAREQVRSYEALCTSLTEALRQARLIYQAGAGPSTDIAQAEARLAEAESGLAASRGNLATAMATLASLAGRPIQPDAILSDTPAVPATSAEAVDLALAHNPQIEQARKAAEVAQFGATAARADRMPMIGAYAEASSVRDQFFPGYKADSASVGIKGKWTFFAGGRVGTKVSKADAEAHAAELDVRATEQMVEVRAIQCFEHVSVARMILDASNKRVAATAEALRSTRLEVKVGAKPQLALLDAEREAIAARTAQIEATGNLLVAAYTLRSMTGMDTGP